MSIKNIYCQDKAIDILQKGYAAEKLAHACIFAGLQGVGKCKTAFEWSKLLLCHNPVIEKKTKKRFADSCGKCKSCQLFDSNSHPDFNFVYKELFEFTTNPNRKKNPIEFPIDVVREFLVDKVSLKPAISAGKVFVVNEAEKLNPSSQNALLKVLEEPPQYCTIILLCTRLDFLLPTTKSRCQVIRFSPIDEPHIIEMLTGSGISPIKAKYLARLSDGSIGQALQWAKLPPDEADLYQLKTEIVNTILSFQLSQALDTAEQFIAKASQLSSALTQLDETVSKPDINRKAQKTVIQIIAAALRDAMKIQFTPPDCLINSDQADKIKLLAAKFPPEHAAEIIETCYQAALWIDDSVNEKLIFEHLLLNFFVSVRMNSL